MRNVRVDVGSPELGYEVAAHVFVPVFAGSGPEIAGHFGIVLAPVGVFADERMGKRVTGQLHRVGILVFGQHAHVLKVVLHIGGVGGFKDLQDGGDGVGVFLVGMVIGRARPGGWAEAASGCQKGDKE